MATNMNKAVAVLAGIVGILAIIPIDVLSWWKADVDPSSGDNYSVFINAWAQMTSGSDVEALDTLYLACGITTIIGAALLFLAGLKASKAAAFLGSLAMIAGPIIFLIAHNGNSDLASLAEWLGGDNVFFGQQDDFVIIPFLLTVDVIWYLNLGFFLPIGSGVLGFLSLKSNK